MSKESEEYQKEYVKFDALLQKHGYQNSFEAALEYADHQTTQLKIELGEKDKKLILFNNDLNTERDRANRNRSIIDDIQKKDGETIALLADKYAEAKKENDINNKLIQAKDIVISTHERINIDLSNQLTASEARVKELEKILKSMLTIYEKYANDDPYEDEIVNYANKLISGTKQ